MNRYFRHSWYPGVVFGLVAVICAGSAWVDPAGAQGVSAGFDSFATPSAGATFGGNQLPAGFFGPGSDPFGGTINFQGVPLLPSSFTNNTDTVVRRLENATLTGGPPPSGTVPIEIVALSLMSTAPITVTYNGGQNAEPWDVLVTHAPVPQPPSSMQIQNSHPNGGTFSSSLNVAPVFTFVRRSDGMMVQETRPQQASEFCAYATTVPLGTNVADNSVFPSGGQFYAARDPNNGQALTFNTFGSQGLTLNQRAASASASFNGTTIVIDTEMLSMDLHSMDHVPVPLGFDYTVVLSKWTVSLSSQRQNNPGPASTGQTTARNLNPNPDAPAINPAALDGQPFMVSSFFDVFFDITITDADPNNNFFNNQPQIQLMDVPVDFLAQYPSVFDMNEPFYKLYPPLPPTPQDPGTYTSVSSIEVPIGDVDGDANQDFLLIEGTRAGGADFHYQVGSFFDPSYTVDLGRRLKVRDFNTDPPFGPITLSGPVTGSAQLETPVVPEPATLTLLALCGLGVLLRYRRA